MKDSDFYKQRARLGGLARAAKLSKKRLSAIGRQGGLRSHAAQTPAQWAAFSRRGAFVVNERRWRTPRLPPTSEGE